MVAGCGTRPAGAAVGGACSPPCTSAPGLATTPVTVRGELDTCGGFYSIFTSTVKPVLEVTSIKQPTCLKQPNKMFPNVKFVLIFTSVMQPPALSSHFLCFPCVAA